jgi:hypothetical protein
VFIKELRGQLGKGVYEREREREREAMLPPCPQPAR